MNSRSLVTILLLTGLLVTSLVAVRAADEKSKDKSGEKVKEEILPGPGEIRFATAPAAVQKTFKEETNSAKIELLGKGKSDKDADIYRAICPIGTNNYDLIVAPNGQVIQKSLQPIEAEVKLEDCPAPVQKALQIEAKGAKVETILRVTAGKRSDFIMDIVAQKLAYQITFTEDGTLMSKVFDDGANADDANSPTGKGTEKKETEKPAKKAK